MSFKSKLLCDALNEYPSIIIYGTGDYAQRIYPKLVKYGLRDKIVCFTQTKENHTKTIDGIPLVSIAALDCNKEECVVLIAVSKLYTEEIEMILAEYRFSNIISLTEYEYRINYKRLEEDYYFLTTFEEYSEYIADWYRKTHIDDCANDTIEQELLEKSRRSDREKNNNLIVMISGHLSARTIKIAGALKRKKYDIVMLSYFNETNPWYLDELRKLDIQIYQCLYITEMLYYSLLFYPLIYFFEPRWGECLWAEILFRNKEYFGKMVLALYDVLNDGYIGQETGALMTEKYSLEYADGIVWRWFSKEYLEQKGFAYQGRSIQFLDYCSHEHIDDILCDTDSDILKLCMVVGYGDEIVDDRAYDTSYIEWARLSEILKKIGNRQDCIFHFYAGGLSDRNIARCEEFERQYPNFKFYIATEHKELMGRLTAYDYGCDIYTEGQELLDDSPMGVYYGSSYRNSVRNSYFDCLNAGLATVTTNAAKMWEYLSDYNIVVRMNLANLDIEYLKQNREYYKANARAAREELDIDNQISRLIHFFKEI